MVLQVFDILRVLCIHDDTAGLVMQGLRIFLISEIDVFTDFVENLFMGDSVQFKIELLRFFNVMLLITYGEYRNEVVDCFLKNGVTYSALMQLLKSCPDEEIIDKIDDFIRESQITPESTTNLPAKVVQLQNALEKSEIKYKELDIKMKSLEDTVKIQSSKIKVERNQNSQTRNKKRKKRLLLSTKFTLTSV